VQLIKMGGKDRRPDLAHELGDPEPHIRRPGDDRRLGVFGIDLGQIVEAGWHDEALVTRAHIHPCAIAQAPEAGGDLLALGH
jgi:hypothetical protein